VIKYAKDHSNTAGETHFGLPPTDKMICEWRKLEEILKISEKNKHSFCMHIAKWHDPEADVKNWITDHRNAGN
jgi:hypothetical protein